MPFDSKFFLSEVELIESNDLSNDEKLASIIELTKICFKPDTNKKRKLNNSFHRNKSFLQSCPEDILFCIFYNMDAKSLIISSEVCSYWNFIVRKSENIFWQHLCIRTFNLVNQTDTYQSYKQTFATQLNVKNGHYFFSGITEDTNIIKNPMRNFIDYNQSRKTITQNDFSNKGSKVVFAWPCHSSDSYHLALDSNKIYWVVDSKNSAINVTCIDDLINFNVEIDKPIRACSFSTNHTSPIALVMSNNEGTLISLDTNSVIKIWDLKENNCERTLNENREHGFIMSVDIYKRKLVTGSETGKILLWDLDSGDVIISLEIPDEYIAHLQVEDRFLNVAIWEDTLVYGLFDGSYHVFDLNLGRIIYIFSTVNGLSVTRFNGDEGKAIFLENHPDFLNSFGNTDELIQSAGLNLGRRRSSNPSEIFSNYSQVDQLLQQLPQIPLLQQLPQIEPILQQLPQIETRRTPQQDHLFQHPPKTLTLNGHILITNGPEADEIAVWDLIHGEALYVLSERFSLRKFNFNIPAFRNVHYAEISKDCSTIFTSVNFEQCNSLLCWDFRMNRNYDRIFKKFATSASSNNSMTLDDFVEFWVVYENEHQMSITWPEISVIIGYIYTVSWSISFYPQLFLNYNRKSVDGLSKDFVYLNLVGFSFYCIYCLSFFSKTVQEEYKNTFGGENLVKMNDVLFALHALILTFLTLLQTFIYKSNNSIKISQATKMFISLSIFGGLLLLFNAIFGHSWILDLIYYLSYVKIVISLIKYVPQAVLNYRLKSTEGWSIGNIMLDFTGGIFSLFQLLLDSYIANNWSGILGNVVKLGLGLISISFDLLFFFQHCTYRNSTKLEESLNNEDNAGLISSHNNCNLRRSLSTLTEETPLL
ncbi:hypothetical protein HK099_008660 [Clydaea vesicula]|uniref:F-box domain-containing protein n=1 Tax=Clydaea vesicula TaxID=447962 RepID=A0AAD5U4R3_9FUNG|nr:hypothetical protein HK099_008660 [Clydaea vesicula]